MPWLLMNWKILAIVGAFTVTFYAGWHGHSWYDAYHLKSAEEKAITKLGEGSANIIDFNQKLDKEVAHAKDDCVNHPHPASIGLLVK